MERNGYSPEPTGQYYAANSGSMAVIIIAETEIPFYLLTFNS